MEKMIIPTKGTEVEWTDDNGKYRFGMAISSGYIASGELYVNIGGADWPVTFWR